MGENHCKIDQPAAKTEDIQLFLWDNREWGEILADYGSKQAESTRDTLKSHIWRSH